MESLGYKHNKKFIVIKELERILYDGRQTSQASSTKAYIGNMQVVSQLIALVLKKEAVPIPRAEVKDTDGGLTDRSMSDGWPTSGIQPTQSRS